MTLDEAIAHALEVAEGLEKKANTYGIKRAYIPKSREPVDCISCAADHRQLAEWLTELKQWRRVYGVCPSYEMCIPECKEGYNAQIAEYKRLLKAAVEDMRWINENTQDDDGSCVMRKCEGCGDCPLDINGDLWCKWKHEEAALKLIGETNEP